VPLDSATDQPSETDLPVKRSVALVIRDHAAPTRILIVRRPPEDDDLPGAWGLPAGSLHADESWAHAVVRSAEEKLGVRVAPGALLNEGRTARPGYMLHMRLYAAELVFGEPSVEQPDRGVTRYVEWTWGEPPDLVPAAARGSLCSRLLLEGT
jgi:8-oxo-dGTP pyrophosphatase MutT (NUDIX family)